MFHLPCTFTEVEIMARQKCMQGLEISRKARPLSMLEINFLGR